MRTSSFALLTLVVLIVAFAVLLLTPHERRSTATVQTPPPLWSNPQ